MDACMCVWLQEFAFWQGTTLSDSKAGYLIQGLQATCSDGATLQVGRWGGAGTAPGSVCQEHPAQVPSPPLLLPLPTPPLPGLQSAPWTA